MASEKDREPPVPLRVYMLLSIPAAFDLLGSGAFENHAA